MYETYILLFYLQRAVYQELGAQHHSIMLQQIGQTVPLLRADIGSVRFFDILIAGMSDCPDGSLTAPVHHATMGAINREKRILQAGCVPDGRKSDAEVSGKCMRD